MHLSLVTTTTLLLACSAIHSEASVDLPAIVTVVRGSVQPRRAMTTMQEVYASDRLFTFPAFSKTATYLRTRLNEMGLEHVEVIDTPADGKTQVGFWTMPLAWDARAARLELLEPGVNADQRVLADYQRVPASLGMWSSSTAANGVEAEIVLVDREQLRNPERLKLQGKLALMDVNPSAYKSLLVKAGALGAINAFTENPDLENGRQWINAWGDSGWGFTKTSTPLLSFSITPVQHAFLRKLLASGPVRARATVDTSYYEGSYPYVTGVLRGRGDEEVLALAHTSEQGAHDNATGVSAVIEAAATLNRLVADGKLPRPRRSIRVLLMGEMYGSMHYVAANPERLRRTVAAICVDTPAAAYELAGTEYSFHMNPHVAKDFTDALILKVAAIYFALVNRPWHEKPFTTGTDTYLAEPFVGVPTVWSYSGSGVETHHNSEDTPDRVDERSMRDLSVVTASYLYMLAAAGDEEIPYLAALSESRAYQQILARTDKLLDERSSRVDELAYALDREKQSVLSVLRMADPKKRASLQSDLAPLLTRLRKFTDAQRERVLAAGGDSANNIEPPEAAKKIIVKRKRFGTIPLDDLPQDQWEGQPSGAWAAVPTIALYWCDGRRTLAEVAKLTQMELGPTKFDFVRYFRFLRKHGYVEFVRE